MSLKKVNDKVLGLRDFKKVDFKLKWASGQALAESRLRSFAINIQPSGAEKSWLFSP